jgi:hypothetical protein
MTDNSEPKNGDLRLNGVTKQMECFVDGDWQIFNNDSIVVELTPDVTEVINWSKEQEITKLSEEHSSVFRSVNQLDTIVTLLQNQDEGK